MAKVAEVAHLPCVYPRGVKLSLFCSMDNGIRDAGHFSNLPHLDMKLGKWPKFQKLQIYPFLPQGVEIKVMFALQALMRPHDANV